jgi:hypothetical protein
MKRFAHSRSSLLLSCRSCGRLLIVLFCPALIAACAADSVSVPRAASPATGVYDEKVFHERVQGLNRIALGASEAEILRTFGPPTERRTEGAGAVSVYRLRCPKPGAPFGGPGTMVYLEWETQITFNQHGRVAAVAHRP